MEVSVNQKIFSCFNNPRIAVTIATGVNNHANIADFAPRIASLTEQLQKEYGATTISQLPKIAAWREAYRVFGVKAKDYPSSIESLYTRVTRGGSVSGINPLVDIYNYISLKYMLPAGGEDADKMEGDLELTYAGATEQPIVVLGREEAQAPAEGEIVYKDAKGTICRRWNWREVSRTILTHETRNCILVLEALNPVTDTELEQAQQELGELVQHYCGGAIQHFKLSTNSAVISYD